MLSKFAEERENEVMNTYLTTIEVFILINSYRALPKKNRKNKILTSTRGVLKIIELHERICLEVILTVILMIHLDF